MCLCFLVAWTPYAVVALMYVTGRADDVPLALVVGAPLFAKTSTWYNPLVYFLSVKRFREDARQYALCWWFKPEGTPLEVNNTNEESCGDEGTSASGKNCKSLASVAPPRSYTPVGSEENHNQKDCEVIEEIDSGVEENVFEMTCMVSRESVSD